MNPPTRAAPPADPSPPLPVAPAQGAASEKALVARLQAGDDAAFEEVVRAASGRMLAVARRLLGREDDAADAVQEAFLSMVKSIGTFSGDSLLSTWLHRITVNACLMRLRARRRRPETPIDSLLPEFKADGHARNPAKAWNPADSAGIESDRVRAVVRGAIETLPEPYREVLMLRDIVELSTDETAAALGITSAAVKTRLHRARQALRELLDPHFAGEAS